MRRRPESTRGRQDEARRNDLAVLDAARDVVAEQGAAASVAAIADRAGVGVGTLYRRYGSKTELLAHACVIAMEQIRDAASAALQSDDAWAGLCGYVRACVAARAGALAPLAGILPATPSMRDAASSTFPLVERVVDRAHAQDGLRVDVTAVDIEALIRRFTAWMPRPPLLPVADDRLLAIALDGLRAAPTAAPLPGPAPTRADLERVWLGGA